MVDVTSELQLGELTAESESILLCRLAVASAHAVADVDDAVGLLRRAERQPECKEGEDRASPHR